MAGHSKWHNIKHKKAATDAKKSKIYTKIAKLIEIAARSGADPRLNPSLETILIKARTNNVPKDIIERAVKKGSGQTGGENLEQIMYEGYGPGGSAIYIKIITSNKNRTSANIRSILSKLGANLGEPGSVSWQFSEQGVILINGIVEKKFEKGKDVENILPLDTDKFEEDILELDILDYEIQDGNALIYTSRENFNTVLKALESLNYNMEEADIKFVPQNYVDLSDADYDKLERIIDMLDDDDDVDEVFHNAE